MNNPTEEQVKEFWEWCGCLEIKQFPTTHPLLGEGDVVYVDAYVWKPTGQRLGHQIGSCTFPPINLNDLFKYAVPRLKEWDINAKAVLETQSISGVRIFKSNPADDDYPTLLAAHKIDADPALALFWALWQVKEER